VTGFGPAEQRPTVEVDLEACQGHGRCYDLCPEIFDSDDDGFAVVRVSSLTSELGDKARFAARNCPEGAISVR